MITKKVAKYITFYHDIGKASQGYYRFTHSDLHAGLPIVNMYFSVIKFGGKGKALAAAKAYQAKRFENYKRTSRRDPFYKPNQSGKVNVNGHASIFTVRNVSITFEARQNKIAECEPLDLWNGYKGKRCQFIKYPPLLHVQDTPKRGSGKKIKAQCFRVRTHVEFEQAYRGACEWLIERDKFDAEHLSAMIKALPPWTKLLQYVLAYERYKIK